MSDLYQIEDATLIKDGDKAILINSEQTGEVWIPKSLLEGCDVFEEGDVGEIEVPAWFARQEEFEDAE